MSSTTSTCRSPSPTSSCGYQSPSPPPPSDHKSPSPPPPSDNEVFIAPSFRKRPPPPPVPVETSSGSWTETPQRDFGPNGGVGDGEYWGGADPWGGTKCAPSCGTGRGRRKKKRKTGKGGVVEWTADVRVPAAGGEEGMAAGGEEEEGGDVGVGGDREASLGGVGEYGELGSGSERAERLEENSESIGRIPRGQERGRARRGGAFWRPPMKWQTPPKKNRGDMLRTKKSGKRGYVESDDDEEDENDEEEDDQEEN